METTQEERDAMLALVIEEEIEGRMLYEIGGRGGYYGLEADDACRLLGIETEGALPGKIGAFCNYLGGGLRGSLQVIEQEDMEENGVEPEHARKLALFAEICRNRYLSIEQDWEHEEGIDEEDFPHYQRVNQASAY